MKDANVTRVPPCRGQVPEETRPDQVTSAKSRPDHHSGCHPREVTLDELLDLTSEPTGLVTEPACRHARQSRHPR